LSLSPAPLTSHGLGFATWHVYDPSCKAELWSTAYFGKELTVLFDPIDWPKDTSLPIGAVLIVRTNANHDRNCQTLLQSLSAHLSTHPPEFHPILLPGGGDGETAYFHEGTSTLVVGDSLINLAPHGLTLLPEKYCTDLSILKISIKRLLDLPIQRIFFAHGAPIIQDALTQLRQLPL
jgi:glyoxylase-like metal-dependent hydrolase (beta-lactamase superfamily II)